MIRAENSKSSERWKASAREWWPTLSPAWPTCSRLRVFTRGVRRARSLMPAVACWCLLLTTHSAFLLRVPGIDGLKTPTKSNKPAWPSSWQRSKQRSISCKMSKSNQVLMESRKLKSLLSNSNWRWSRRKPCRHSSKRHSTPCVNVGQRIFTFLSSRTFSEHGHDMSSRKRMR